MDFKQRYTYDTKTDLLGKGGFATVYRAKDTLLDREVAIKFFKNPGGEKYDLISEIRRSIGLEHANVCRYYDALILDGRNIHGDVEHTEVGIMEYLDGGTIAEYLVHSPKYLDKLLLDTLRGLAYLHQKRIAHRDIKPGNVLVKLPISDTAEPIAKITDLGISKELGADVKKSTHAVGSLAYMAPEQIEPLAFGVNGAVATNADIWSFGVLVYELVTGKMLFDKIDTQTTGTAITRVLSEDISQKIAAVRAPYRELLEKCLVRSALERCMYCGEVIMILERADAAFDRNNNGKAHVVNDNFKKELPLKNVIHEETAAIQKANSASGEARVPRPDTSSVPVAGKIAIGVGSFILLIVAIIFFAVRSGNSETTYPTNGALDSMQETETPPTVVPEKTSQQVDAKVSSGTPSSEDGSVNLDDVAPLLSEEELQKRRRYLGKHLLGVYALDYDNSFGSATIILKDDGVYYLNGSQKNKLGDWMKINGTINIISLSKFMFTGTISAHMPGRKPSSPDCKESGNFVFELFAPGSKHWRMRGLSGMGEVISEPCDKLLDIDIYF